MKNKFITGVLTLYTSISMSLTVFAYNSSYDSSMDKVCYYFDNGYYCEAMDELSWIDYYSCSDEQKQLIDSNKSILQNAINNVDYIYRKFDLIQSYCDRGLYYEAMDELVWLEDDYILTPLEYETWCAKYADAQAGIQKWENRRIDAETARQYVINMMYTSEYIQNNYEYSPKFEAKYMSEDTNHYYFNGFWYNDGSLTPGYRLMSGIYFAVDKQSCSVYIVFE